MTNLMELTDYQVKLLDPLLIAKEINSHAGIACRILFRLHRPEDAMGINMTAMEGACAFADPADVYWQAMSDLPY